jgi:hypothetical protein
MPAYAPEDLMIGTRSALLAASLFVAGPAIAATPSDGRTVWVPTGDAVVVVPRAPTRQIAFPVARQEAMMATPLPTPDQIMRAAMRGMPQVAPGAGVVVTSVFIPGGTCSQTIYFGVPSRGAQPVMKVVSTGNACGAIHVTGPIDADQPAPQQAVQPQQRLWTIGYPAHPATDGASPRT